MIVLSIDQVCELLGCKRRQVFYLLKTGILEAAPKIGRSLRIYKDSVERALTRPTKKSRKKRETRYAEPALISDADIEGCL